MMNLYCIYDNLYEEYQQLFTLKNDNIARIEYNIFINNQVEKSPDSEKQKMKNRFILLKFDGITYRQEVGAICVENEQTGKVSEIYASTLTMGEDDE